MENDTQILEGTCYFLKRAIEQTTSVFVSNVVTVVLESVIAVCATTSNAFIAFVIWKTIALHCPSNTLLCCLAVTDFLTGLIAAPLNIVTKFGEMQSNTRLYCVVGVAGSVATWIIASVTFLTLTLISIERYLALQLHLRYKTTVTSRRILQVIALFWIFVTTLSVLRFWDVKEVYVRPVIIGNIVLNLVVTMHCYRKIYGYVKHHRRQIRKESSAIETSSVVPSDGNSGTLSNNQENVRMLRYKRSTLTMVYVVGCFIICYSPILVYQVLVGFRQTLDEETTRIAYRLCITVALLKSALNPLLYCMRLNDIRIALRRTLKDWHVNLCNCMKNKVSEK